MLSTDESPEPWGTMPWTLAALDDGHSTKGALMSMPLRNDVLPGAVRSTAVTDRDRRRVVTLHGDLDLSAVDALGRTLATATRAAGSDVVVNLADVDFIDAATIGVFVHYRQLLRHDSRDLVVRAPSAFIGQLLNLCGLGDLVENTPTVTS